MKKTRRSIIKTSGIAITGIGAVDSTKAKDNKHKNNDISVKKLDEKILNAYHEDGNAGVSDVMEDRGIEYNSTTSEIYSRTVLDKIKSGSAPTDNQEDAIEPTGHYDKSDSEFTLHTFDDPNGEERIRVQMIVNLNNLKEFSGRSFWLDDLISISFDPKDWGKVGDYNVVVAPDEAGSGDLYFGSIDGDGIAARIDQDSIPNNDGDAGWSVVLAHSLTNRSGDPGTIYGGYTHSWAATPVDNSIDEVTINLGTIEVNVSGVGSDEWTKVIDEDTYNLI